jgi:kynureninase
MVALPDSHPAQGVVASLRAQGITTDARSQTLRLSPGVMTSATGVARLAKALHTILR